MYTLHEDKYYGLDTCMLQLLTMLCCAWSTVLLPIFNEAHVRSVVAAMNVTCAI